uniref:TIL domain-containing protein n=1 Tax=Ditylenchus dipsaci TaxID=166011 RepID=A0A915D6D5_9BILA
MLAINASLQHRTGERWRRDLSDEHRYSGFVLLPLFLVSAYAQNTPPPCPPNQERVECARPPACEISCQGPPQLCREFCDNSGCQCKAEFVYHNGSCILPQQCPSKSSTTPTPSIASTQKTDQFTTSAISTQPPCPENQERVECARLRSCEATCEGPPGICPKVCVFQGCQCQKGFVYNNGSCISPEKCPPKSTTSPSYKSTTKSSPKSTTEFTIKPSSKPTAIHSSKPTTKPSTPRCGPNEEFKECICERSCNGRIPFCPPCYMCSSKSMHKSLQIPPMSPLGTL